ncbi:MAG: heavy metal translocating P-type ATPase [Eubacteriales bacterium]|nr:heavy metal translocating P-type ATPase [Eubacteriales bacterium]
MKQKFNVTGMSCSACSAHVEKAVSKVPGVDKVQVNLLQNSMVVEYAEGAADERTIVSAVEAAGYGASAQDGGSERKQDNDLQKKAAMEAGQMKRRLGWSIAFLAVLMYVSMGHMLGWPLPGILLGHENMMIFSLTQLFLTLPVMYLNRKYFENGFRSLLHRSPNMDTLVAMGSTAAFVYSASRLFVMAYALGRGDMETAHGAAMNLYFESAAMILALVTIGKYLESRSKSRTSDAITKLMDLAPKTALVERDGTEQEIPAEQVQVGDIVIVKPGQGIPVDGVIVEGTGTVDESAITGESIPAEKKAGDRVTGATVNRAGYFRMRTDRVGADTTLAQIIRLVEDAGGSKAPIAKLADKVSGVFVPVVIGIALVTIAVWLLLGAGMSFALASGIAVLVISCPCALGLATPTAIMVGTGRGAEQGILIKSGESLETAHLVDTVVLDKTGTITEGHPAVTDVIPAPGADGTALLRLAASIEKASEHPLAEAIVRRAQEDGIEPGKAEDFAAEPGQGVSGTVEGRRVLAGNRRMMETQGVALSGMEAQEERLSEAGRTVLYIAADGALLGLVAVADPVKATSAQAIREMERMGLSVVMLTGDNERTAKAIQRQLGISRVVAQVLPQDKEREVRRLQEEGHKVAMVGDGINDAPALARADLGVAIGAGTDVAIESADVVLMKSDLLDAAAAVQLSRAVIRNIKENLFWAFCYNAVGIPLAAGVFYPLLGWQLSPMFGSAAMSFSSVFVVCNALRLRGFRPDFAKRKAKDERPAASGVAPAQAAEKSGNMEREPQSTERAGSTKPQAAETAGESRQEKQESKEEKKMEKTIRIEGMMCAHCTGRVDKALNAMDGVTARVSLEDKAAYVTAAAGVSDEQLKKAVEDAGYEVVGIE